MNSAGRLLVKCTHLFKSTGSSGGMFMLGGGQDIGLGAGGRGRICVATSPSPQSFSHYKIATSRLRCLFIVTLLVGVFGAGCGRLNMQVHYANYRDALIEGNFDDAGTYIKSQKKQFYGKKNRLLYYMDRGAVLRMGGRFKESNTYFEKAKNAAEELWTDSIGENAEAWLTTDNSISYQGEDFEKVAIHLLAAMNYLDLGDYSAARVEARQITARLALYNQSYGDDPNHYSDDAFARWLSGRLQETDAGYGGANDAWIDYKKAMSVYQDTYKKQYGVALPRLVVRDALRVLGRLGADFSVETSALQETFPDIVAPALDIGEGRLLLLHLAGEAPQKVDRFWQARAGMDVIRIAWPEFVSRRNVIVSSRLRIGDARIQSEIVQDIEGIAIENLRDRMGRIKTRAIARAVAKFIASKALQGAGASVVKKSKSRGGKALGAAMVVGGAVFGVASVIAEEADKRSWVTLPAKILAAELVLPAGVFDGVIELLDRRGVVVNTIPISGEIKAGETSFITHRSLQ